MRGPHNIIHLIRTGATLERTGALEQVMEALEVPKFTAKTLRVLAWPFKFVGHKGDPSLPPTARALTAMGPAYIKFGQILSTRPDVAGEDLAQQLRVLQDKLPPFPIETARQQVAHELGRPVDEIFDDFSPAIAAASIAQVHKARLKGTDQNVAVKVLRPGIERAFRRDIDAFYFIANTVELLSPSSRRLHPTDVVAHFEGVVLGELDLRLEAASASEFAANTEGDEGFQLPRVNWNLSARRVMTLDWADGVPLGDNAALDAAGHDRVRLSERVLQLFLSHALRDGFFHADMHQGNLMVSAEGDIIAYDFGIMGHIDEYTRRVYAEILYGFIKRDYHRIAEVHFEAGYVPADRDMDEFARALRAVGEPIFGMDASHISMGNLLNYLFEVTERFGMETRTELILLQRTMVVVEGVARSLDSQLNIWQIAKPVVENYIRQSIGPKAAIRDMRKVARVMSRFGPQLPTILEKVLTDNAANTAHKTPKPKDKGPMILAVLAGALGMWLLMLMGLF